MSYNWTISDAAYMLVTEHVQARELARGDVISNGDCLWAVAEIVHCDDGTIEILDDDGNGFAQMMPEDFLTRLPRSSVNLEAVLRNMKQERA